MHRAFLRIYHILPGFLKNSAATLHGYRLNRWRYGPHFQNVLPKIAERDGWSREQWATYQNAELQLLLQRAVRCVPYYRRLHESGRFPVEKVKTVQDLTELPILEKEVLRGNPRDFLAEDCHESTMYEEHTSGTTGTPLTLYWSHQTQQEYYAIFEWRVRRWNRVKLGDSWAHLGGQLVASPQRRQPPFWVWNAATRQLYLSVYHLLPEFLDYYLDEIEHRKIQYILGYSGALNVLAAHVEETGRSPIRLKTAIGGMGEAYYDWQRRSIDKAFNCVSRNCYGCAELVSAASECEWGTLHMWPEVGWIELVDEKSNPVKPGEPGEMLCTGLLNKDQVLIRYKLGDRAILQQPGFSCKCGRKLPAIEKLDARVEDVLKAPDGRQLVRLDTVFKATIKIKEAQIAQQALNRFVIRCVPASDFNQTDAVELMQRLRERVGAVEIKFEIMNRIPRTSSGKFKGVVNEMFDPAALMR